MVTIMRITTQMLNRSAQRAGLPANRTSLLNYINGNNSNVSLANALSKTNKAADATKKTDYEKLERSADQTVASTDRLLSAGSENVTASDLQNFVDKYNDMLKNLGKSSDTLNLFYAQTAKDTVKEYTQELAELGVTVAKDGTLSFARAGFEKTRAAQSAGQESAAQENAASEGSAAASTASGADMNALFAKESGFFSKLNYLASRVSDYADANAESYSDYYNAAGFRANAYSNGKYNFWS
ncbi:MAG: hypothetical protein NC331_05085 [Lachnospiraceae bacterium]|nr:hypothetical protein [Lachnospiraceae bacterium]